MSERAAARWQSDIIADGIALGFHQRAISKEISQQQLWSCSQMLMFPARNNRLFLPLSTWSSPCVIGRRTVKHGQTCYRCSAGPIAFHRSSAAILLNTKPRDHVCRLVISRGKQHSRVCASDAKSTRCEVARLIRSQTIPHHMVAEDLLA
jgi:hypothetical protein